MRISNPSHDAPSALLNTHSSVCNEELTASAPASLRQPLSPMRLERRLRADITTVMGMAEWQSLSCVNHSRALGDRSAAAHSGCRGSMPCESTPEVLTLVHGNTRSRAPLPLTVIHTSHCLPDSHQTCRGGRPAGNMRVEHQTPPTHLSVISEEFIAKASDSLLHPAAPIALPLKLHACTTAKHAPR